MLRADAYLRFILTVIAFSLVWICLRDLRLTPAAHAQSARVMEVKIVGVDTADPLPVDLAAIVGREIVESETGMVIGVAGVDDTIIPIHWGQVDIYDVLTDEEEPAE